VPVLGAFQLDTGLVDYGMWIEMFTRAAPPPKPQQPYLSGRIWS
jgi:cyanobactin cluster PatC/TenC/TruC protein